MKINEKEIERFIQENREEMIRNVCELVQIPSVACEDGSGYPYGKACAAALDYIKDVAEQYGLRADLYDYQGVEIRFPEKENGKRILFAAHADVVPPSEGGAYPPFGGIVENNYIIGRGVVDDKAPLIAVLYAMIYIRKKQIPLHTDVRLFCGSHEETDMKDILYYLERAGQPHFGLAVDDDFPVTNGEKGILQFVLRGRKEILKILADDKKGEALGIYIASESVGETVCSTKWKKDGRLWIDARIPTELPVSEAKARVLLFAEKEELEMDLLRAEEGYYISGETGVPKILTDLYNEVTKVKEAPYVMKGCTYARHFKQGCGFGAGNPHERKPFPKGHGGAHQPDEAHNIDVFFHAVKMYILGILRLDEYCDSL